LRHELVTCQISISLDGYVAGPNQSLQNPLRRGRGAAARVGDRTCSPTTRALEPVEVIASPAVTHIRYRVVR
jgi:hypothetical protein